MIEIVERLAHAHEHDIGDLAVRVGNAARVFGVSAPGQSPRRSRATMIWPTISAGVRLRTSFCVPVWQKLQVSVQPTWLEMQSVPRSSSGI